MGSDGGKTSFHSGTGKHTNSEQTSSRRYRRKKRRFHRPRQALGRGFESYTLPGETTSAPDLVSVTEAKAESLEAMPDKDLVRELAVRGLWFCACMLILVPICLYWRRIVAAWNLAAKSWPGLDN